MRIKPNSALYQSLQKFSPIFLPAALFSSILSLYGWTKQGREESRGLLQPASASWPSRLHRQLCSGPGSRTLKTTDPAAPTLLLSLAGAAGDEGLPRLRPGSDRAAGGGVHPVHTPGGTSNFRKEETEEGKRFHPCMRADSWIEEDLTPTASDRALLEDSSNHYL